MHLWSTQQHRYHPCTIFSPSAPKIVRSSTAFKTPPHMSHTVTTNSRLALNKEPSPAALHALLHGRILSESPEPFSSTRSSLVTAPEGDSSIQATPVADMEVGESPDLFEESKKPSVETVVSKPTVSFASRAARMLTYDSEDPLVRNQLPKSILKTPDKGSKEQSNCSSGSGFAAIPSKGVFFLSAALDPSIENESASMAAFALSTPTKEDPVDFHQAFHPEGNYWHQRRPNSVVQPCLLSPGSFVCTDRNQECKFIYNGCTSLSLPR